MFFKWITVFYVFKITSEDAFLSSLEGSPYHVAGKLMVVKKWQHGMLLSKSTFSSISV